MEKIQELTDKLYREGVEKGNAEGMRLVEKAKAEADKLVADARKEADEIVDKAHKQAPERAVLKGSGGEYVVTKVSLWAIRISWVTLWWLWPRIGLRAKIW